MLFMLFFKNKFSSIVSKRCFFFFSPIPFVCMLYGIFRSRYSSTEHSILAGFPPTTIPSGTDLVTTEPAATIAPSPIVTPGIICACAPI